MGRKWSEEEKKRHSERLTKFHAEYPESGAICFHKGYKWSEEAKKKRTEKIRKAMNRPEVKKLVSENMKEVQNRPEMRKANSERAKKQFQDPIKKERHRKATQEALNRPEVRKTISEGVLKRWNCRTPKERSRHTLPGRMAMRWVSKPHFALFGDIKQDYPQAECHQYVKGVECDIVLRELKINIEYDGAYWHRNPKRDKKRDEFLQKLDWTVLRVREGEVFDINVLHRLVEEKFRGKGTTLVLQGATVLCQ